MMEKVHSGKCHSLKSFAGTYSLIPNSDFSSHNDDDIDNSIHSHTAPPFLMNPDSKLFSTPGSFNFSMAALAADSVALAGRFHFIQFLEFESNQMPISK